MFGKRIKLFKIFGFEVGIEWSWIILAIEGILPLECDGQPA